MKRKKQKLRRKAVPKLQVNFYFTGCTIETITITEYAPGALHCIRQVKGAP